MLLEPSIEVIPLINGADGISRRSRSMRAQKMATSGGVSTGAFESFDRLQRISPFGLPSQATKVFSNRIFAICACPVLILIVFQARGETCFGCLTFF